MPERAPHPSEINFRAWVDQWLTVRFAKAAALGQPIPSAEELSAEMVQDIIRARAQPEGTE